MYRHYIANSEFMHNGHYVTLITVSQLTYVYTYISLQSSVNDHIVIATMHQILVSNNFLLILWYDTQYTICLKHLSIQLLGGITRLSNDSIDVP